MAKHALDLAEDVLVGPDGRHTLVIVVGCPNREQAADEHSILNCPHDVVQCGLHVWHAVTAAMAQAAGSVGGLRVGGVSGEPLDSYTLPQHLDSMEDAIMNEAKTGTWGDVTDLVLCAAWPWHTIPLPLQPSPASGSRTWVPNVTSWQVASAQGWCMAGFLYRLTLHMPMVQRLSVEFCRGFRGAPALPGACPPGFATWREEVDQHLFTALPSAVPAHWRDPLRPGAVRWLGDQGDSAGAGYDAMREAAPGRQAAGQAATLPHAVAAAAHGSTGSCHHAQPAWHTSATVEEVSEMPGAFAGPHAPAELASAAEGTNGLWRELCLTGWLPPAPPLGSLGHRLREVNLWHVRLTSRDVASLPHIAPNLHCASLYYCRGYSRLSVDFTGQHFAPELRLDMYQSSPGDQFARYMKYRTPCGPPTAVHDVWWGPGRQRRLKPLRRRWHTGLRRRTVLLRHAERAGGTQAVPDASAPPPTLQCAKPVDGLVVALAVLSSAWIAESPDRQDSGDAICISPWRHCLTRECPDIGREEGDSIPPRLGCALDTLRRACANVDMLHCLAWRPPPGLPDRSIQEALVAVGRRLLRRPDTWNCLAYPAMTHDRDEISGYGWHMYDDGQRKGDNVLAPLQEVQIEMRWSQFWADTS